MCATWMLSLVACASLRHFSPNQSEVAELYRAIVTCQQEVEALEISMDDGRVARVQICHGSRNVQLWIWGQSKVNSERGKVALLQQYPSPGRLFPVP